MNTLFENETREKVEEEEESHSVTITDELHLVKDEIPEEKKKKVTQVMFNTVYLPMPNLQSPSRTQIWSNTKHPQVIQVTYNFHSQ